jgi:glucosamine kinase
MEYGFPVHVPLVIGVDAGATSTRCLVSTIDGMVVGRGRAGGANRNSSGGRPAEALTFALRAALDVLDPTRVALGVVAYRRPPAALGLLAPLVSTAAQAGDEVARRIVEMATAYLLHALEAVSRRVQLSNRPAIVLAGSVLLDTGPVAERVRAGIWERFRVTPTEARDGAAGAAALAIAGLTGVPVDHAVHGRLTAEA